MTTVYDIVTDLENEINLVVECLPLCGYNEDLHSPEYCKKYAFIASFRNETLKLLMEPKIQQCTDQLIELGYPESTARKVLFDEYEKEYLQF